MAKPAVFAARNGRSTGREPPPGEEVTEQRFVGEKSGREREVGVGRVLGDGEIGVAGMEGVAFPIAEHLALLHASRLVAYEALALADVGQLHTVEGAMAEWLAPKQAAEAIQSCLLFHGWSGYGNDLPLAQRHRDIIKPRGR